MVAAWRHLKVYSLPRSSLHTAACSGQDLLLTCTWMETGMAQDARKECGRLLSLQALSDGQPRHNANEGNDGGHEEHNPINQ